MFLPTESNLDGLKFYKLKLWALDIFVTWKKQL